MARCDKCNKKVGIQGFDCKWCSAHTCLGCHAPEKHQCVGLKEMKSAKQEILASGLMSAKTDVQHNYEAF